MDVVFGAAAVLSLSSTAHLRHDVIDVVEEVGHGSLAAIVLGRSWSFIIGVVCR